MCVYVIAMPLHVCICYCYVGSGSRNVETLLQLMFEGEIEATDEGLHYNSDAVDQDDPQLTFDNVF